MWHPTFVPHHLIPQVWKKPPLETHPWPPLWSSCSCPTTPTLFAIDVSKPSDLAVLTGGYFRIGMAKPSATHDGHRKKKKEGSLRGCAGWVSWWKGSRGSSRVCVRVCSQPTIPVTKCSVGVMCCCRNCCWNWRFLSLAKPRQTLEFILWQLFVVSSAFHPHHSQHHGFVKVFYSLQIKTAHFFSQCQCACWFAQTCSCSLHLFDIYWNPSLGKILIISLLALGSWQTNHLCLVLLLTETAHREICIRALWERAWWTGWAMEHASERAWHLYLHLKHHLSLWDLTNSNKKTCDGPRHQWSCLMILG